MNNIKKTTKSNEVFIDEAENKPKIKFPLDAIGTSNRPHYITVLDPFSEKKQVNLFSNITILLNLAADKRGLHMSRIEKSLHELSQANNLSMEQYLQKICQGSKDKQGSETSYCKVSVVADYERYSSKNSSGKPSHEIYKIFADYEIDKNKNSYGIGLEANIMNSCPCAQRWGMRDYYEFLKSKKYSDEQISELIKNAPRQSHTNRGKVKIYINSNKVKYIDLHNIIEQSSPIVRELLGADDEHAFIKNTHKRGLFCEDIARELAQNTLLTCIKKKLDPKTKIQITVEMDESIHYHNVYCKIDTKLSELEKDIKK